MRKLNLAAMGSLMASLMLAACGGDSGSGGSPGGGPRGGTAACQTRFSVEAAARGDDCTPQAEAFCAVPNSDVLNSAPLPCDGVSTDSYEVTAGGLSTQVLVIKPASGGYDSVLLALHYLNAKTGTFSNVVRLSELAKARRVLIIAPQAPSLVNGPTLPTLPQLPLPTPSQFIPLDPSGYTNLGSRWPTSATFDDIDSYVTLLEAVVAEGRSRFGGAGKPLYAAGLSNGAVMAYYYGCRTSDPVRSIMAVAGEFSPGGLDSCAPTKSVGTVIVHGTADILTPYQGAPLLFAPITSIHARFREINGCTGSGDDAVSLPTPASTSFDPLTVTISYTGRCNDSRRDFLVTVINGGHNWPGGSSDDSILTTLGLFGTHTRNFDATLQGFDLLRAAGGD